MSNATNTRQMDQRGRHRPKSSKRLSGVFKSLHRLPTKFVKDCGFIPVVLINTAAVVEKHIKTKEIFQTQGTPSKAFATMNLLRTPGRAGRGGRNMTVHDAVEAMKLVLVGLPEPLIPEDVCDALITASRENSADQYGKILGKFRMKSPLNFGILHFMMILLKKVSLHTQYNMMDVRKLATIFVLDVIKPLKLDDPNDGEFLSDRMQRLPYLIMVVEKLIKNVDIFHSARGKKSSVGPVSAISDSSQIRLSTPLNDAGCGDFSNMEDMCDGSIDKTEEKLATPLRDRTVLSNDRCAKLATVAQTISTGGTDSSHSSGWSSSKPGGAATQKSSESCDEGMINSENLHTRFEGGQDVLNNKFESEDMPLDEDLRAPIEVQVASQRPPLPRLTVKPNQTKNTELEVSDITGPDVVLNHPCAKPPATIAQQSPSKSTKTKKVACSLVASSESAKSRVGNRTPSKKVVKRFSPSWKKNMPEAGNLQPFVKSRSAVVPGNQARSLSCTANIERRGTSPKKKKPLFVRGKSTGNLKLDSVNKTEKDNKYNGFNKIERPGSVRGVKTKNNPKNKSKLNGSKGKKSGQQTGKMAGALTHKSGSDSLGFGPDEIMCPWPDESCISDNTSLITRTIRNPRVLAVSPGGPPSSPEVSPHHKARRKGNSNRSPSQRSPCRNKHKRSHYHTFVGSSPQISAKQDFQFRAIDPNGSPLMSIPQSSLGDIILPSARSDTPRETPIHLACNYSYGSLKSSVESGGLSESSPLADDDVKKEGECKDKHMINTKCTFEENHSFVVEERGKNGDEKQDQSTIKRHCSTKVTNLKNIRGFGPSSSPDPISTSKSHTTKHCTSESTNFASDLSAARLKPSSPHDPKKNRKQYQQPTPQTIDTIEQQPVKECPVQAAPFPRVPAKTLTSDESSSRTNRGSRASSENTGSGARQPGKVGSFQRRRAGEDSLSMYSRSPPTQQSGKGNTRQQLLLPQMFLQQKQRLSRNSQLPSRIWGYIKGPLIFILLSLVSYLALELRQRRT